MNSGTPRGATMADSILNTKREGFNFKDLPPGFRFHPTDEELITHYLSAKAMHPGFTSKAIGDVNFNKCEPWDLPSMARIGEKEKGLYFFCQRDRKYPTGMRTNRATEAGYWKATGKDREIYKDGSKVLVGMKKTLVFYLGRAPIGEKTNWIMHEYRLEGQSKGSWVVCRVFQRKSENKKSLNTLGSDLSCMMNPQEQHQSLNSNRLHEQEKLRAPSHLRQSPVQSIVTALQDAVFSPEANTEISSIVPKNESSSYQPFNYDLQAGSFEDLENIYWNL